MPNALTLDWADLAALRDMDPPAPAEDNDLQTFLAAFKEETPMTPDDKAPKPIDPSLTLELEQYWSYSCNYNRIEWYDHEQPGLRLQIRYDPDTRRWYASVNGDPRPFAHKTATEALRVLKALHPEYKARGQ
jgi:hypothetical protein